MRPRMIKPLRRRKRNRRRYRPVIIQRPRYPQRPRVPKGIPRRRSEGQPRFRRQPYRRRVRDPEPIVPKLLPGTPFQLRRIPRRLRHPRLHRGVRRGGGQLFSQRIRPRRRRLDHRVPEKPKLLSQRQRRRQRPVDMHYLRLHRPVVPVPLRLRLRQVVPRRQLHAPPGSVQQIKRYRRTQLLPLYSQQSQRRPPRMGRQRRRIGEHPVPRLRAVVQVHRRLRVPARFHGNRLRARRRRVQPVFDARNPPYRYIARNGYVPDSLGQVYHCPRVHLRPALRQFRRRRRPRGARKGYHK